MGNVLDRDDRYWPFRNLVKDGVSVGLTAGGDSGRTSAEMIGQNGPREAYPTDLDPDQTPDVVLYSVGARSKNSYRRSVRERYRFVYTDKTSSQSEKIRAIRYDRTNGKVIAYDDERNFGRKFDYIIMATGYERDPIEAKLASAGIEIKKLKDSQGNVVGKGNLGVGVMIGGTALGFKKEDFPQELINIIDILGVGENTVSLWVYNVLFTRLLWSNGKVSERKVRTLLNDLQINGSAMQLRKELTQAIQGKGRRPKPLTPTQSKIKSMAVELAKSAGLKVDEQDLD